MLSILVPVFNWDIRNLVQELYQQCLKAGVEFEIIALDDCSTLQNTKTQNREVQLPNFQLIELQSNLGNAEARNKLVQYAKFQNLLFLDADVQPTSSSFIQNYLLLLDSNQSSIVYCGGLQYLPESKKDGELRWKYGVKLEVQSPEEAQENPYLNFKSCNFLIDKSVMEQSPFVRMKENYGFDDTSFAVALEKNGIQIKYTNNPIYHLGLEPNQVFLEKQKSSVKNAFWMIKNRPEIAQELRIVKTYNQLKSFGLNNLAGFLFKLSEPLILKNLSSRNPSVFLFQVYKLGYFCTLKAE